MRQVSGYEAGTNSGMSLPSRSSRKRWFLCDKKESAAEPLNSDGQSLKTHLFTCFQKRVMIDE